MKFILMKNHWNGQDGYFIFHDRKKVGAIYYSEVMEDFMSTTQSLTSQMTSTPYDLIRCDKYEKQIQKHINILRATKAIKEL